MGWWQRLVEGLRGGEPAAAPGPPDPAPEPDEGQVAPQVGHVAPGGDDDQPDQPDPPDSSPRQRFWVDYNEVDDPDEMLAAWIAQIPDPGAVEELVVGSWPAPYDRAAPVKALAAAAPQLSGLTFLRVGDMGPEDCEMSWILHTALDPVLLAYGPQLTRLEVQGSQGLDFEPFTAPRLEALVFESGGLPGEVVGALANSTLPALTRLELWLGTEDYGSTVTAEILGGLFASDTAPALAHLGLLNSDDPLRDLTALVGSPWLQRISSLDLSLGVIGDECVEILTSGAFGHLAALTVKDHHYLTADDAQKITAGLPGVSVEISGGEEAEDEDWDDRERYRGRWVSVGE